MTEGRPKLGALIARTAIQAMGGITSTIVLLIVLFLFKEGVGFFTTSPVPDGQTVALASAAGIESLKPEDVVAIQEGKIKTWDALGGARLPASLLTIDQAAKQLKLPKNLSPATIQALLPQLLDSVVQAQPGTLLIFPTALLPKTVRPIRVHSYSLGSFLANSHWNPTRNPIPQFGALAIILGTVVVTLLAIALALPLGLAVAVYLAELARPAERGILKPMVELLAGIPSVVYGFFGLVVVVPLIQHSLKLDTGLSALAGGLLLALISLPTIITVSEDALRNVPRSIKEASLALGATHWQTIIFVTIPYALSGIAAGAILGVGRAVGETMAVLMVTGNANLLPSSITQPVRTLPATIAQELGEAPQNSMHYKALFVIGIILFIITFGFNLLAQLVGRRNLAAKS